MPLSSTYRSVEVKEKYLTFPIRSSGQLGLKQEVLVAFRVGGSLKQVFVEKGSRLRKGQVLATLDKTVFEEQYYQAKANYERIKEDLKRLEHLLEEEKIGTAQGIRELQTSLKIASSRKNIASQNLQKTTLNAPNSGIVLEKFKNAGEVVGAGQPVVQISDQNSGFVFRLGLSDEQVVKVALGNRVEISLSAFAHRKTTGKVSNISNLPSRVTGLYEVEVQFEQADLKLKSGFIGKALIYPKTKERYKVIPAEALIEANRQEGRVYFLSKKHKKIRTRSVKIAYILDNEIAILSGLEDIHEVLIP